MGVLDVLVIGFVKWRSRRAPPLTCGNEQSSPVDAIVRLLKEGDGKDPDSGMGRKREDPVKPARSSLAAEVPNVGQSNCSPIETMDLALHGNAIAHWQDEPDISRSEPAAAEGGIPHAIDSLPK